VYVIDKFGYLNIDGLLKILKKIQKNMLRWFGHVENMDERRLT
jgi:hypothetical protein